MIVDEVHLSAAVSPGPGRGLHQHRLHPAQEDRLHLPGQGTPKTFFKKTIYSFQLEPFLLNNSEENFFNMVHIMMYKHLLHVQCIANYHSGICLKIEFIHSILMF